MEEERWFLGYTLFDPVEEGISSAAQHDYSSLLPCLVLHVYNLSECLEARALLLLVAAAPHCFSTQIRTARHLLGQSDLLKRNRHDSQASSV